MKHKEIKKKYIKPASSKNGVYFYSKKSPDFDMLLAVMTE